MFSQKHNVSETGSVSVLRWNEDCPFERRIQFPKRCVLEKILDDDKVQKPDSFKLNVELQK
jgi:hypothetical protein